MKIKSGLYESLAMILANCPQGATLNDFLDGILEGEGGEILKLTVVYSHGVTSIRKDYGKAYGAYGVKYLLEPDDLKMAVDKACESFLNTLKKEIEKYSDRDL